MPLHESEAIILQRYTLGESDRLVSFLSRTMGKMRGVAAGARKPKSRFGATLERLSYIRIWFFERETRELVRISQCEMIESFLDAFSDYPSSVALALFSEITETVLPDREPSDRKLSPPALGGAGRQAHRQARSAPGLFRAVDGQIGRLAAFADALCALRRMSWTQRNRDILRRALPQLSCAKCRKPGMRMISPAALGAARIDVATTARPPHARNRRRPARAVARELADVMLDVIERQIDRKLKSRELLEVTRVKLLTRNIKMPKTDTKRSGIDLPRPSTKA